MADAALNTGNDNQESHTYDSLEPLRKKAGSADNDDAFTKPKEDDNTWSLNLNNRKERLSRWIIGYFIFVIAELTANSIDHRARNIDSIQTGYSLFIASDVFLFIGCVLAWFSMHVGLEAAGFLYINYIKYTAGFLFILSAILHWPAIHQLSRYGYCTDDIYTDNTGKSYCQSYIFATHWMGHFFAICIGIDLMDLNAAIYDNKRLRMFIYAINIFLMYMILGSDVDYFNRQRDLNDVQKDTRNAMESGYFLVSVCCGSLLILIIISYCNECNRFDILNNSIFKNLFGLCILIGTGLVFYTVDQGNYNYVYYVIYMQNYNTVLSFLPIVMIVYDLQTYDSYLSTK